jgi:hypothetical protein
MTSEFLVVYLTDAGAGPLRCMSVFEADSKTAASAAFLERFPKNRVLCVLTCAC